ncbi:MAG: hypothetical protein L6253_04340 [Candidatus Atribacteria bacterium]|nr:hypothetical protein [Candidatus Atribacteria bacterium]
MSAILFLYRHVLKIEPDETVINAVRPQKPKHVPTVLSKQEAKKVIENMQGIYRLMAQLLYGSGLRLMEVLRLRVKACPELTGRACRDPVEGTLISPTTRLVLSLSKHHRP